MYIISMYTYTYIHTCIYVYICNTESGRAMRGAIICVASFESAVAAPD